jgi:phosphoribosylformimino-5-aminoimidazole carboxamide ribotide isomerase
MIEIIPAIDIIDGKCVRLQQGDYGRSKVYGNDPADIAKKFEDNGIKRLHLVDLDGARTKRVTNWKTLEKIARLTSLVIDFGGGIKTDADLRIVFESGASMAVTGSIAVTDMELFQAWLEKYGSDKFILGADVRDRKIAVSAWFETTSLDLIPFLKKYAGMGVKQVICTDIARDGMLEGPSFDIYTDIIREVPGLKVIASGGISTADDIIKLAEYNVHGVIIGKAIYEGKIKINELNKFL